MVSISVSDIPQGGKDLEHYAAALFQAAGYYVEASVEEMEEGEPILELDLVATEYHDGRNDTFLGEAKSGGWGYSDVFKIGGWMQYLGVQRGVVICPGATLKRDPETLASRAKTLSIDILDLGDFSDVTAAFNALGLRQITDELLVEFWRYSYWIEEVLVKTLRQRSKAPRTMRASEAP